MAMSDKRKKLKKKKVQSVKDCSQAIDLEMTKKKTKKN